MEWVNYIIRATLSTPSPPEEGVQAPIAATIGSKEEENEAKENGRHPLVDNWPCTLWRMCLPVSHRHLARKDECNGMGEEPQENRRATEELKYPCNPQLGQERNRLHTGHAAEPAKEFQTSCLEKEKARRNPEQKEGDLPCSIPEQSMSVEDHCDPTGW